MLNIKLTTIFSAFCIVILCISAMSSIAAVDGDDKIGIFPFSRLASANVQTQIGDYYKKSKLENALAAALKKEGISVKNVDPQGQLPFTYEGINAPQFDIDADDFATPEQILGEIASQQGFSKIIFGHLEEISDSLFLVVRVYFVSLNKIQTTELSIKLKNITSEEVGKSIDELAGEVEKIMQNQPQSYRNMSNIFNEESQELNEESQGFNEESQGLVGFSTHTPDKGAIGYTVEDIYRMVLEYEFYVHPSKKHQNTINALVQKFSTTEKKLTKKKLTKELKDHSRDAKTIYKGQKLIIIRSKPIKYNPKKRKKPLIAPSTEVFNLCIFNPYELQFGNYEEANYIIENIIKKEPIFTRNQVWMPLNDWRIPTIKELFVITEYLPWDRHNKRNKYYFLSSELTAQADDWWVIIKYRSGTNLQGQPTYGIEFDTANSITGKALLVAVRNCP